MGDDGLDELYGVKPEDFTALRSRLAAEAKGRGDVGASKAISASRKPTTAAWVVNRLALEDRQAKRRLADLGERLRAAHAAMDGDHIRELSAEQRTLIHDLARSAFDRAGLKDPPAALRDDVTDTLQAAIADPDIADRLGRLAKAQRYSGFGELGDTASVFTVTNSAETEMEPTPARKAQVKDTAREKAAVAAAEKARGEADDALSERKAELDEARRRHGEARRALRDAERKLHAAEGAHEKAEKARRAAVERVKEAQARLRSNRH
ncbi:hypothetical protein [Mycobacterium sp.]|uniref:hypothetical protein n=1 Tax=Mycobacterium sp. TaxID=1785 RepID=UPI002C0AEB26|nr:hypothetical protein [Mycobacterium sp.]HME48431.1 hypothetical protein [Mycobacterium sp.]